jgi:hypothetical protein
MSVLRYPLQKLDSDDFLKIDIYDYQPGGLPTESSFATQQGGVGVRGTIKQSILLPMTESTPRNTTTAGWGDSTLGPLQAGAYAVTDATLNQSPLAGFGALADQVGKVSDALGTALGKQALSSEVGRRAIAAAIGSDPGSILSRTGGIIFNENIELIFKGVSLRAPFTFTFSMSPRSEAESRVVKDIIRVLKKAMAPSKGAVAGGAAGLFIKAPNVFKLSYKSRNQDHPFLNRFKVCALLAVDVDFTPDGTYTTYKDSTPVHTRLSLSFQELTPIYSGEYDSEEGTIGVGY